MSAPPEFRILNVMLAKGAGGLEHACADYHEALEMEGHEVLSVTHPKAWVNRYLTKIEHITSRGAWDIRGLWWFHRLCDTWRPDAIIAHGNRAINLAWAAPPQKVIIGVYHNTWIKRTSHLKGAITITPQYRQALIEHGFADYSVKLIPNMVHRGRATERAGFASPPVIGSMGRFSPEKGFDLMLMALADLKERGIPFRAVIHGEEARGGTNQMTALRNALEMEQDVDLPGWTRTPRDFLGAIDIYLVPSRREGLSIAFLEAMEAGCPIVSADIPGLVEAAEEAKEAHFFKTGDHRAMADGIARLLRDPALAADLGQAARTRALTEFEIAAIAPKLSAAVTELTLL